MRAQPLQENGVNAQTIEVLVDNPKHQREVPEGVPAEKKSFQDRVRELSGE
jgi:hypothetical protein